MSVDISDAMGDGFGRFASRTGAILAVAYLLVYAVYQAAYNTVLVALTEGTASTIGLTLGVPVAVAAGMVVVCLVGLAYLIIVAARTFVADTQSSFPGDAFSRNVPAALANQIVGGIIMTIGIWIGSFLFVVPGVFLGISLMFVPIYVAAEDDNFVTAFGRSWSLASGNRWNLFLLSLTIVVVSAIAALPLVFVGALGGAVSMQFTLAVAFSALMMFQIAVLAAAYEQLGGKESGEQPGAVADDVSTSPV